MSAASSQDLFVGAVGLVLLPLIAWRIVRGVREGRLPVYRTYLSREESGAKFNALLGLHVLSFLAVGAIAADLLFGLRLKDAI